MINICMPIGQMGRYLLSLFWRCSQNHNNPKSLNAMLLIWAYSKCGLAWTGLLFCIATSIMKDLVFDFSWFESVSLVLLIHHAKRKKCHKNGKTYRCRKYEKSIASNEIDKGVLCSSLYISRILFLTWILSFVIRFITFLYLIMSHHKGHSEVIFCSLIKTQLIN